MLDKRLHACGTTEARGYSHICRILQPGCPLLPHGQELLGQVCAACLPHIVVVAIELMDAAVPQVALPVVQNRSTTPGSQSA
jgi:hypothetical protein